MRWVLLLLVAATPLAAQRGGGSGGTGGGEGEGFATTAIAGVVVDGYYFGSGFAFDHVVEWTLPLALSQRVGSRLTVDLSTAYARASGATTSGTLQLDGITDTDVRASWAAVSGHVIVSLVGTLPTGRKTVSDSAVPLLSALATDLLGFTTPTFGSGGGVTGGFVTAFRLGERWAGGLGGSYRWHASYTPVTGSGELEPGGEGRMRLGVEGPVGGRGYFRSAALYTASGADTLNGGSRSISGDRILLYASLSLPAGPSSIALYGYEMRRLRPRAYNATYLNAVQVPRGNVLTLGIRLDRQLSPALSLAPNAELRHELVAPDTGSLELLGWLVRPGLELRWRASGSVTLVLQGQAAFGRLADNGSSVTLVGPRGVVLLQSSR
ncbi:MAG TPA: hypothetical protein VEK78_13600 [Gemmatimonadales bacterium]|nr:hypothetical protein [Gemmatimonadales bacterium]